MNGSEREFDRAIASSLEAVCAPVFPATVIRARIAQREAKRSKVFGGRFVAAAALLVCSAGLAFGAPKVLNAIHFKIGSAKFALITPDMKLLNDPGLRELSAERSFHARLPLGWPAYMQRGAVWRVGPSAARSYIIQYSSKRDERAGAVVLLQKAVSNRETGLAQSVSFRQRSFRSREKDLANAHVVPAMRMSWTTGDERVTIISKNVSEHDLARIRQETK